MARMTMEEAIHTEATRLLATLDKHVAYRQGRGDKLKEVEELDLQLIRCCALAIIRNVEEGDKE